jgi:hypothetical protein
MKKTILICGVPVEVTLTEISEKDVPRYIRTKFEKESYYMQTKRSQSKYHYFCKEGLVSYYMGEIPIKDGDK